MLIWIWKAVVDREREYVTSPRVIYNGRRPDAVDAPHLAATASPSPPPQSTAACAVRASVWCGVVFLVVVCPAFLT